MKKKKKKEEEEEGSKPKTSPLCSVSYLLYKRIGKYGAMWRS